MVSFHNKKDAPFAARQRGRQFFIVAYILAKFCERIGNATYALTELLLAGGVGEADVALGAESRACDSCDMTDGEEVHGEVAGVADSLAVGSLLADVAFDIGEEVEGAGWHIDFETWDLGEEVEDDVAAFLELCGHLLRSLVAAGEGSDGGSLGYCADAGCHLTLKLVDSFGDVERCADVAHAPTCHGVAFGHAVCNDGAVLHSFHLSHGEMFLTIGNHVVDLVAEHENLWVFAEDGCETLEFLLGVHAARWVGGGAEDEEFCLGGDGGFELLRAHLEVLLDACWDDYALALGEDDLLGVGDPVWRREDNLVALVDDGEDDVDEAVFSAGGDDDLVDVVVETEPAFHACDDSLAEVRVARDWWVVCLVVLDGLDGSRLDVFWCVEIRLADGKIDNVKTLRLELTALLCHGKGRRL